MNQFVTVHAFPSRSFTHVGCSLMLQCVDIPEDLDFEDVSTCALAYAFEEFNLLRALEIECFQLGAIATWQWHQICCSLGPVWIHGGAGTMTGSSLKSDANRTQRQAFKWRTQEEMRRGCALHF